MEADIDVFRLRDRGCFHEAAALLQEAARSDPDAALRRASVLVEAVMFTPPDWAEAEAAVALAETIACTDDQRASARLFRGQLAYARTFAGVADEGQQAREAFAEAERRMTGVHPLRPWLAFRLGVFAQNIDHDAQSARRWLEQAQNASADPLLHSYTQRHLGMLDVEGGDLNSGRARLEASLRLRLQLGFLIGVAPALAALAYIAADPTEAAQLRADCTRWVEAMGGPPWLQLSEPT